MRVVRAVTPILQNSLRTTRLGRGGVGGATGDEDARKREQQGGKSRGEIPGAQGSAHCPTALGHRWPRQMTLVRDEASEVGRGQVIKGGALGVRVWTPS